MKTRCATSMMLVPGLAASLLWAGCAAPSTVASRKQERAAVYAALPDDQRALVDQGRIAVGMDTNAVYIAWGSPARVLTGESAGGPTVTWLYAGRVLQEYRYWNYRYVPLGHRAVALAPHLDYDYFPATYIRAEVVFENGRVKSWRTLEPPR